MKIGFLQEEEGVFSVNRLIFMVGSFWTMALVTYFALTGSSTGEVLAVFAGMQGTLIGLKLGQKAMETKLK